ncbi:MAG: hypothetical protein Q4D62_06395 [Planctomycetia bacterium]|nr:hypothetical protein [Planctomycetia bacterium]
MFRILLVWGSLFCGLSLTIGQEPEKHWLDPANRFVPKMQTLGGFYFWQDIRFQGEWRIQYNVFLKHYRLLNPQSVQYAIGSLKTCETELQAQNLPPMQGRVLILVHGFGANRLLLQRMAGWFRQRGHYSAVLNVTYPSTSVTIQEQAAVIGKIVERLEGVESIDLVGHSLGSLILRCYLGNPPGGTPGTLPDPRIHRFVQICPPNQGSALAARANQAHLSEVFSLLPLHDLGQDGETLQELCGTPACEFGIIAGGKGDDQGYSPTLPGDDDFVISVSTTPLPGASDYLLLPGMHSVIPNTLATFEYVERFLETGAFQNAP